MFRDISKQVRTERDRYMGWNSKRNFKAGRGTERDREMGWNVQRNLKAGRETERDRRGRSI